MNKRLIILALVVFIALWILYKVNTATRLDYQIGLPKEISLKGGQLSFLLPLRVINPSGGTINLKGVQADINTAGQYLGRATIDSPVRIGPRQETVINVAVAVQYFDLVNAAGGIWTTLKGGKVGLEIDGLIYAEGFQIPIKNGFDFQLPKL
ncbi:LEA/WHy family protein [Spirosoma areae]